MKISYNMQKWLVSEEMDKKRDLIDLECGMILGVQRQGVGISKSLHSWNVQDQLLLKCLKIGLSDKKLAD